jgi:hypothetical protein
MPEYVRKTFSNQQLRMRVYIELVMIRAKTFVNTFFTSYHADAQTVMISTNCSSSIARVEFYSTYFYIFWHLLHISWEVT